MRLLHTCADLDDKQINTAYADSEKQIRLTLSVDHKYRGRKQH